KEKMVAFDESNKERLAKLEEASKIPQFRRDVVVGRFGMHNCDMFAMLGGATWAHGEFHFDDAEFEKNRESVTVIAVLDRGRIGSNFSAKGTADFVYCLDKELCLIAI